MVVTMETKPKDLYPISYQNFRHVYKDLWHQIFSDNVL